MATVSWVGTTGGKWNTASDWSTGAVPGAGSDVEIFPDASMTVTYTTGSITIDSLFAYTSVVFDMTGGAMTVTGWLELDGAFTQSGGSLSLTGGPDVINDMQKTAGTLDADGSELSLAGTGTIGGTLTGAWLVVEGAYNVTSAAGLGVAELTLDGGLTVSANATISAAMQSDDGALVVGAKSLVLSGQDNFFGTSISGTGTLTNTGSLSISQDPDSVQTRPGLTGSLTFDNTGALSTNGNFYIGVSSSDDVTLINAATGTWTLLDGSTLGGQTVQNAGTLVKGGGQDTTVIDVQSFTSTGTILVSSGTLSLQTASSAYTLGGALGGAGTLLLQYGTYDFSSGISLSVASIALAGGYSEFGSNGTEIVLESSLTYGGALTGGGLLYLNGNTLTLSGNDALGDGGSAEFGTIPTEVEGSGEMVTTGTVSLSAGLYDAGADILNASTATMMLGNGATVSGTLSAQFNNAGVLDSTGNTIIEAVAFTNTGTVTIGSGTLSLGNGGTFTLGGSILGAGALAVDAATTFASNLSLAVGTLAVIGGTLTLGGNLTDAKAFALAGGATIALGSDTLTLRGATALDGGSLAGGNLALLGATSLEGLIQGSAAVVNSGTITADGATLAVSSFTSSKILSIGAAGLRLGNGTSGSASLAGTVTGQGPLILEEGTTKLASKLVLSAAALYEDFGTLSLGASMSYAGTLGLYGGTLALAAAQTLTLSGTAILDGEMSGKGTLALTGQSNIQSLAYSGALTVTNAGTSTVSSIDSATGTTSTLKLINLAAGTMNIAVGEFSSLGGTFQNAGTLTIGSASGQASSYIQAAIVNTGTFSLLNGNLTLDGAVSGVGQISIASYASMFFEGGASGGTVTLGTHAALETNIHGASAVFSDVISGFSVGDLITIGSEQYSSSDTFTFNASLNVLTLSTGETLKFASGLAASDFQLVDANGNLGVIHT